MTALTVSWREPSAAGDDAGERVFRAALRSVDAHSCGVRLHYAEPADILPVCTSGTTGANVALLLSSCADNSLRGVNAAAVPCYQSICYLETG